MPDHSLACRPGVLGCLGPSNDVWGLYKAGRELGALWVLLASQTQTGRGIFPRTHNWLTTDQLLMLLTNHPKTSASKQQPLPQLTVLETWAGFNRSPLHNRGSHAGPCAALLLGTTNGAMGTTGSQAPQLLVQLAGLGGSGVSKA